jgi:hypothetical protein
MLWNPKQLHIYHSTHAIDKAYCAGALEERRQIIAIMDRIIDQNDHIEQWSCALRQARAEVNSRNKNNLL